MNKREFIDYNKLEKETFDNLDKKKHIVLATCLNDEPTARTVSYIILDNKIYFQTDIKFDKCMQIEENNNVALCLDNYQIEGTAKILEHPRNKTENRLQNKPTKRNIEWSEQELLNSVDEYRLNSEDGEIKHKNYMRIDNTNLSAKIVAKMIKDKFKL